MLRAWLLALAFIPAAHAQAPDIPRTADGRPDLRGYWSNEFQTPLEPTGATAVVYSEAVAKSLVDGILVQRSKRQVEAASLMAASLKA